MATELQRLNYEKSLMKSNDMNKNDKMNSRYLSNERYDIMDTLMDSMNPQKQYVSTEDMNSKIDSYLNEQKTNELNSNDRELYANMAKYLSDQINQITSAPNFDIASQSEKIDTLMTDLKKVNMKLN
jgi:hypothetical protein